MRKPCRIIPMVECNTLDAQDIGDVQEGIFHWVRLFDEIIIVSTPGKASYVCKAMLSWFPAGPRIIPGIKVSAFAETRDDILSVSGWETIWDKVFWVCGLCHSRTCWMDMETALKPYVQGNRPMPNMADFAARLAGVPPNIKTAWFPTITYRENDDDNFDKRNRQEDFTRAISDMPGSILIDNSAVGPGWIHHKQANANRGQLIGLNTEGSVWRLVRPQPGNDWYYEQIPGLLETLNGTVVLFPGSQRWVEAGKALSHLLTTATGSL